MIRPLSVNRESPLSITRQIYLGISAQILDGSLAGGERLPSTRELAYELGVSRNVAIEAYEQLAAEGFALGISGSGTFVAKGARLTATESEGKAQEIRAHPHERGDEAKEDVAAASGKAGTEREEADVVDFVLGRPALDLVPYKQWSGIERECCLAAPTSLFGSAPVEGIAEFREILCDFLRRRRGMECSPQQIVVTYGAIHGLCLLANILVGKGAEVVFEDPGHVLARTVFLSQGAYISPARVDEEGIVVDELPRASRPVLAFVTPSHQFPLGGCLSIQRRIALIEWARKHGCLLVEDDYESEFRYDVAPVSSLQRLDPDNVVYVGTFSKVFIPAIRLGYLVLPERLFRPCLEQKRLIDRYCTPFPQMAMTRFISEGRLERHIARMRKVYRKRRDALVRSLEQHFPKSVSVEGRATGLHLAVTFKDMIFDAATVEAIRKEGTVVHPIDEFMIKKGCFRETLAMGYSHLHVEEIERGVEAIARAADRRSGG